MRKHTVTSLRAGVDLLNEPFLLQDLLRRVAKDGRPYILATLRDRTGQVGAIYWDVPDYVDGWIRPGLVTLVTGRVNLYKDALQVAITDLNPSGPVDMGEFLPSSKRPRGEMLAELREHIESLAEPWQTFVAYLLLEEPLTTRFANAPAARGMHHAYVSGLMEHTLSMARLARFLASFYPYVNYNLLLAGTLFHDMGKAEEYSVEDGFAYSDDGRLVGHITRAVVMVEKAAAELGFPDEDLRQLVHLIASHHGTNEWGSPIVPKTLEAVLLHQIDLMDSRVQGFLDHVANDTARGTWTTKRSEMFGTELQRPPGME